ncbi:mitogen-activated protein kinase kinase kinase 18-like [Salvia splendens]|uniref:mitogen-activated protein kinase kinase kinase 18-like n=1 Tax=Salvia splendens TaxID=180675 RepID=UPI001C266126|nr:mitogen-activated protein kinase kinase kinase 18-like [Salvia splendens]
MRNTWLRGSCIGRGAYGSVNAAVNTATGNIFAVKSVNLATASPSQVEALESEIAILRSLSSPFIVKYLGNDTTSEGSSQFTNLHMEYLPAGTAADLSDRSEAAVASYAWCLVAALSYIHSRGIVHCDVKGKNVLLGHSPGTAALADFGSAVDVDVDVSAAAGRGSPLWMAPEAIRGERQAREADVWSVGCTVIEMLTGKPAWGGSVWRIGYSDEVPLFPARISGAGADFLEKCLRRDYRRRWSCDQLLQHPFLMMGARKEVACHWSPRCVLDCLSSDFHEEEEEEYDGEIVDLEGSERISGLVSAAVGNWDSDGWVVVRGGAGGTCSENSGLVVDTTTSLSRNLDFDFQTCVNSNSNSNFEFDCNVCTKISERLYNCRSNYGFVYVYFHIIRISIEFVLLNLYPRSGLNTYKDISNLMG